MEKYNSFQKNFLTTLGNIQENVVESALCNYKDGDDLENLLLDVTYNVVFDIMLFIDGYYRDDERLEILNTKTGEKLKENPFIELHDSICDYLKYEK